MAKRFKIVAAIVGSLFLLTACADKLGERYVSFAQCLSGKDVKMYGAYWCPHCSKQKKIFGKEAFRKITYIECDPRGEGGNPDLCIAKNIKGYPTWEFADGSRIAGETSLIKLSEKTGCPLPPENS